MQYRSISDLNESIVSNLSQVPRDIDLVVGVPRSGLLAANLLSLAINVPLADLDSFLAGLEFTSGSTKPVKRQPHSSSRRKVLLLDDSIHSGAAMREVRAKVANANLHADIVYAAVYGLHDYHSEVDFIFEKVPMPRIFQWNFMHHQVLRKACVDIDGVLCLDPSESENDDGDAYLRFLQNATPYYSTTQKIGWLVTSRLEKYRGHTEAWLANVGVSYDNLIMLDLPSKKERQRLGCHGTFKAEFYRNCDSPLFIESDARQAEVIAEKAGKPVLCIETHQIYMPDPISAQEMSRRFRNLPSKLKTAAHNSSRRQRYLARRFVGDELWGRMKGLWRHFG